jgi:DNA-binding PadR family transcriptional regulator
MPSNEVYGLLPLHPLEFRILLALHEGTLHGYAIVKHVEASEPTWSRILPANLYRRIRDLRAKGLIAQVEAPEADDTRRKYFSITRLGQRVAREETLRLRTLVGEAAAAGLVAEGGGGH